MVTLQDFKDDYSKELYGMTAQEAIKKGICIDCGLPALERCYSIAGEKEYYISGLCEKCFDKIFDGDE